MNLKMSRLTNKVPRASGPVVLLFCLFVLHPEQSFAVDEQCLQLQAQIESGDGLSPRGRKVLFSSRTRQDDGRFGEAAKMMQEWISDHPDQAHHLLYFNLATSQLDLDHSAEALENLERTVALEPRFSRGWLRLGEAAYEQLKYARAAEAFQTGHNLMCEPRPEIRYYSAVAWLLAKEPEKALAGFDSLLRDHKDLATLDWYQALVAAASEAGSFEKARPWLENCLVENEADPRAWYLAYQFAAAEDDYDKAAVYLTVVGHLRPLKRDEHLQLGDLYAQSGVPIQAARSYQKALEYPEYQPRSADYLRLASAWMAAHQNAEARAVLDRGIATKPTAKLLALLGDLNYAEKNYADARSAFRQCVTLDAEYGRGWLMCGYCSMEMGENDEARSSLQRAKVFSGQGKVAEELLRRLP